MKYLVWHKKDITEKQLVAINEQINNVSKYHTVEQHNYYIKKKMLCPYCNLGSEPVPKAQLKELIE